MNNIDDLIGILEETIKELKKVQQEQEQKEDFEARIENKFYKIESEIVKIRKVIIG